MKIREYELESCYFQFWQFLKRRKSFCDDGNNTFKILDGCISKLPFCSTYPSFPSHSSIVFFSLSRPLFLPSWKERRMDFLPTIRKISGMNLWLPKIHPNGRMVSELARAWDRRMDKQTAATPSTGQTDEISLNDSEIVFIKSSSRVLTEL